MVAPLLAEIAPDAGRRAVAARHRRRRGRGHRAARRSARSSPTPTSPTCSSSQHDDRIYAVPGDKLRLTPQPSVDGARRLFSVDFDAADAELVVSGEAGWLAANQAFDRGAIGGRRACSSAWPSR